MAKKSSSSRRKAKASITAVQENTDVTSNLKPNDVPKRTGQKSNKSAHRLPNVIQITQSAAMLVWQQKYVFAGIGLVYGLLNLVLVQGLTNNKLANSFQDHTVTSGFNGFFSLLGSSNSSSSGGGAFQFIILVIASLATIWALRQTKGGVRITLRDAYYKGMYPLVPFILVLVVIGLQLIPLVIGAALYSTVVANGITVNFSERAVFGVIFALLAAVSLYMVIGSLIALYVASLPNMAPIKALRTGRKLVKRRRWSVLRKLLFLPVVLLLLAAVIIIPVIIIDASLASWVFFALTMFAIIAVHSYIYTLYQALLDE